MRYTDRENPRDYLQLTASCAVDGAAFIEVTNYPGDDQTRGCCNGVILTQNQLIGIRSELTTLIGDSPHYGTPPAQLCTDTETAWELANALPAHPGNMLIHATRRLRQAGYTLARITPEA